MEQAVGPCIWLACDTGWSPLLPGPALTPAASCWRRRRRTCPCFQPGVTSPASAPPPSSARSLVCCSESKTGLSLSQRGRPGRAVLGLRGCRAPACSFPSHTAQAQSPRVTGLTSCTQLLPRHPSWPPPGDWQMGACMSLYTHACMHRLTLLLTLTLYFHLASDLLLVCSRISNLSTSFCVWTASLLGTLKTLFGA